MSETPTLPAIPEAAIEALVADLVQECERAIKQHEAALLDPSKRGGYIQTHDTMFGFIVRKHVAALPHLSIPSAPAQAPGGLIERLRAHARMIGMMVNPKTNRNSSADLINEAIAALTAADARVAELEREAAQWQAAAGQSLVRAEALEDRLETVERERDEARDRARILGDKYNQWFERAERLEDHLEAKERECEEFRSKLAETIGKLFVADAALEAELARLQSAQPAGDRPDSGEAGRTLLNQDQINDD